jgi:sensor domain CHASE-containing protein
MSLKSKIGLILLSVFVLYGVVDFGIQRFVIFPSFLALERKEAITDVKRSVEALQREINFLDFLVWDWAAWDDTYEFIQTRSDAYIDANLVEETFTDDDLNVLYFIDTKGKVIWGETRDRQMEITHLPEFPAEALPAKHPLLSYRAEKKPLEQVKISGVYMTRTGPMLISSRPILTSQSEGPARGSVIMAKYLTDKIIKKLAEQTQVDFQIFPIVGGALPEPLKNISDRITDESRYLVEAADSDNLNVYTTVPDTKGDAVLLITTKIPRDISAQGFTTMRYALYSIIAAGVGVLLIMLLLLQWTILKPLTKLTRHALAVGKNADLASRLDLHRKDELGTLANEFNEMVKKLSDSRSRLMQLSRDAGMADVATGVLHNVGNVMNSINVSRSSLTASLRIMAAAGSGCTMPLWPPGRWAARSRFIATGRAGVRPFRSNCR